MKKYIFLILFSIVFCGIEKGFYINTAHYELLRPLEILSFGYIQVDTF